MLAFASVFFIWAAVSPLDIVSDAIGEVIPSSRVKKIQHLEGGIVREIKVREGDLVKVGQPLIELEATASDSTVEELTSVFHLWRWKLRDLRLKLSGLLILIKSIR